MLLCYQISSASNLIKHFYNRIDSLEKFRERIPSMRAELKDDRM